MHRFPDLLPEELNAYRKVSTPEELYDLLIKTPPDLILFFTAATDDETWSEMHSALMKQLIDWVTLHSFQAELDASHQMSAAQAIRKHYVLLQPLLPENIEIQFKDKALLVNSLLFSKISPFFESALLNASRTIERPKISFINYSYKQFAPFELYMQQGYIPYLYKLDEKELIALLKTALLWNVSEVVEESQRGLFKYISRDNVEKYLLQSHQEGWELVKQRAIDFINSYARGYSLYALATARLGFKILHLDDDVIDAFNSLSPYLTDLSLPLNFPAEMRAVSLLRKIPHLIRVDLSRSDAFVQELFATLPQSLEELDLSECPWLKSGILKQFAAACPSLEKLNLSANSQLKYAVWGELTHFAHLRQLNLSRCQQISSADLKVILKACPRLTELILDHCKGIDEEGFGFIGKALMQLNTLSLSYCLLSDRVLAEIALHARSLTSIFLSNSENITEKGVMQLIKGAPELRRIDLSGCKIPAAMLKQIKRLRPLLENVDLL